MSQAELPYAFSAPTAVGQLRASAQDFVVDEWLDIELEGEGEHLWFQVRKTGENTTWVARQLARLCDVPQRQVSYAGLKDRHAITTQWFSVQCPAGVEGNDLAGQLPESVEILQLSRHRKKLRRGAHRGNHFVITLREVDGDRERLNSTLEKIAAQGFPNYFGEQRFGRDGGNIEAARRLFSGVLKRVDRNRRSLYLSAARSQLFNLILAARITDGSWLQVTEGETLMLDGSHSVFQATAEELPTLQTRLNELDVHTTGVLWGRGAADERERALLADESELCLGLESAGLDAARRALRCRARDLRWSWPEESALELRFTLDSGNFATSLLRELITWRAENNTAGDGE